MGGHLLEHFPLSGDGLVIRLLGHTGILHNKFAPALRQNTSLLVGKIWEF